MAGGALTAMSQNLGVYFEQLKDPNISIRIRALRGLPLLTIALGISEVISSVFPALGFIASDVDEVCCTLTDVIPELSALFRREDPEYVSSLLPILESLASSECMLVLDATASAFEKVSEDLSDAAFNSEYCPMVERFLTAGTTGGQGGSQSQSASGQAGDQGRYSPELGVLLIPSVLRRVSPDKRLAMVQHYTRLVKEYGAVIKNHIAMSIKKAILVLSAPEGSAGANPNLPVLNELEPVVERLSLDPHTVVRKTNLECLLRIAYECSTSANLERFFKASSDNSWQVRLECTTLIPLAAAVIRATASDHGSILVSTSLINAAFASLAADVEIEVQNNLYATLPDFFATVAEIPTFFDKFTKTVTTLVVRTPDTIGRYIQHSFGTFLTRLTATLLEQQTRRTPSGGQAPKFTLLQDVVFPTLLNYLDSPILDIKLAILENLPLVMAQMPPDQVVARLVPPVAKILENNIQLSVSGGSAGSGGSGGSGTGVALNANTVYTQVSSLTCVKESVIPVVLQLAHIMSDVMFNDLLVGGVQRWMRDNTWSVRIQCGRLVSGLVDVYGADWFVKNILGTLGALLKHKDFKVRSSMLLVTARIVENTAVPVPVIAERIAPLVTPLLADIDNVKCAALECALAIVTRCAGTAGDEACCTTLVEAAKAIPSGSCREVDRLVRLIIRSAE